MAKVVALHQDVVDVAATRIVAASATQDGFSADEIRR